MTHGSTAAPCERYVPGKILGACATCATDEDLHARPQDVDAPLSFATIVTNSDHVGAHVHVRVFVGLPGCTRANVGTLVMRPEEAKFFEARVKSLDAAAALERAWQGVTADATAQAETRAALAAAELAARNLVDKTETLLETAGAWRRFALAVVACERAETDHDANGYDRAAVARREAHEELLRLDPENAPPLGEP